jgi:hypothetical protein
MLLLPKAATAAAYIEIFDPASAGFDVIMLAEMQKGIWANSLISSHYLSIDWLSSELLFDSLKFTGRIAPAFAAKRARGAIRWPPAECFERLKEDAPPTD